MLSFLQPLMSGRVIHEAVLKASFNSGSLPSAAHFSCFQNSVENPMVAHRPDDPKTVCRIVRPVASRWEDGCDERTGDER